MKGWLIYFSILFFTCFVSNVNSTVLTFNSEGKISGIEDYRLQTSSGFFDFDIKFIDGSCVAVVDGCINFNNVFNYNSIHSPAAAILRAIELYTDTPNLIEGCESDTLCNIFIPQHTFCCGNTVTGQLLKVFAGPNNETVTFGFVGMTRTRDLSLHPDSTYAVFSISSDDDPVIDLTSPSALWFFGPAFFWLFVWRRRVAI